MILEIKKLNISFLFLYSIQKFSQKKIICYVVCFQVDKITDISASTKSYKALNSRVFPKSNVL
jgi:hypothetical protein